MALNILNGSGALYFSTGLDNRGLQTGAYQAKGIIRNLAKDVSGFDVFAGLGISAGIAFTKIANNAKKFSEDFEQAMKEVQTISQAVQGDFQGYSDQILRLSTQVPDSAEKLSAAYYQIVSAGYDGQKGMKLLETSSKSAVGGVSDVLTAADGLTTVLNAWKIEVENVDRVSDALFNTVKLGKTTFGELSASIAQVAPLASSMNISMDEVLSAIASLTKQGVPTAQAITQIRSALTSMNDVLGDGWSNAMTFQEGLVRIREMAGGSQTELKEMLGRIEAVNAVLGTTGENAKGAAEDLESYTDVVGAADEAFKTMVESSINQGKILQNNLRAAIKPLGDYLSQTGTNISRALNEAFETGEIYKWVDVLKIGITTFVAYKTTTKLASISMMDLKRSIVIARKAQQAFNLAAKANPIGLVVAGLTTAAGAFVMYKNRTEKAKEEQSELNDELERTNRILSGASYQKFLEDIGVFEYVKDEFGKVKEIIYNSSVDIAKEFKNNIFSFNEEDLNNYKKFFEDELVKAKYIKEKMKDGYSPSLLEEMIIENEKLYTENLKAIDRQLEKVNEIRSKVRKEGDTTAKNYLEDTKQNLENAKNELENLTSLMKGGLSEQEQARINRAKELVSELEKQYNAILKIINVNTLEGAPLTKLSPIKGNSVSSKLFKTPDPTAPLSGTIEEEKTAFKWTEKHNYALQESLSYFSDINETIAKINPELAETVQMASEMVYDLGNVITGFATGNLIQGIAGGVGLVSNLTSLVKTETEKAIEAQSELNDEIKSGIEAVNNALERQIKLLSDLKGLEFYSGTESVLGDIEEEIKGVTQQLNDYELSIYKGTKTVLKWYGTVNKAVYESIDLTGVSIEQFEKLRELYESGDFQAIQELLGVKDGLITAEQYDGIILLLEQYDALIEKQKELTRELFESLTGTTAQSLEDAITEGFQAGETPAKIFANSFGDLMQSVIEQTFRREFLEKQLSTFYETFAGFLREDSENGTGLSAAEIQQSKELYSDIISQAEAGWEGLKDFFDSVNIDPTSLSQNSLSGAIRGMDEQTAGLLAGQFSAIRINTSEMLQSMNSSLIHLQEIAQNTRHNRHLDLLPDIRNELRNGNSIRSLG